MKNKAILVKSLVLVITLVFIAVTASFAWFNFATKSTVDEVTSNVIKVTDMQISTDKFSGWSSVIEFDEANVADFKPVSGDGTNFFKQTYETVWVENKNGQNQVQQAVRKFEAMEEFGYGASITFFMENRFDADVYLSSESFVQPASLKSDGTAESFRDYVAGAMRVALYKKDSEEVFKPLLFWIPNTTYELTIPTTSGTAISVNTASTNIEDITFRKGVTEEASDFLVVETNPASSGCATIDGIYYIWGNLNEIEELEEIAITSGSAGETEEFMLRIWMDADDRECSDVFTGGKIKSSIKFNAIAK